MKLLNHHNGRFVWLRGPPGTGKTAIAKSIADSLARDKRLAASFFWDKTGSRANADTIELFPSTLANQLAMFSRDYEALLVQSSTGPVISQCAQAPAGKANGRAYNGTHELDQSGVFVGGGPPCGRS